MVWCVVCTRTQASCGGTLPTKRRKPNISFRYHMLLMANWAVILAVAGLGSRTTVQLEFDTAKVCCPAYVHACVRLRAEEDILSPCSSLHGSNGVVCDK